jgi:hypothetical protein
VHVHLRTHAAATHFIKALEQALVHPRSPWTSPVAMK